jgi:tetratricopeptide (TPR) repeat protein
MKKVALRIILVVMLVLGVSTMSLAKDALKDATADLDKGWQNLDTALLDKTVKSLEEMAKKNPKDHSAPYYAAKAHYAIADCLDIKSNKVFDETGDGEKHIDAALELIKTSLAAKEDSADTHVLKFTILRRKMYHVSFPKLMMYIGDRKAAYDRAKALAPDSLDVQLISAFEVADGWPVPTPEKVVAEFEKLLKKDPKWADVYYEIGAAWEKAKKNDDAKKNYEKAIKLDPNHHWAKKKLKGLASPPAA